LRLVQRVVRVCLATRFYIFWNKCFVYLNIENENQHTMSKLTKREIENKRKAARDTLKLINLYKEHFYTILGKRGVEELVNQKLDELIYLDMLSAKNEKNEDE